MEIENVNGKKNFQDNTMHKVKLLLLVKAS